MFALLVEETIMSRLNSLQRKESSRFKEKLKILKRDPFPDGHDNKEIKGSRKSAYRLRVRNYRFFYVIDKEKRTVKVTEFLTAEQAHKRYGRV